MNEQLIPAIIQDARTGEVLTLAYMNDEALRRTLDRLLDVLRDRFSNRPEDSYSASLFDAGRAKILKKINEEATEVVMAATHESRERLVSEIADLVYHLEVLMVNEGVDWVDVEEELRARER